MIRYLSLTQVIDLHAALASTFGGPAGVRDRGGLESAIARPTMTFDGEELYPDVAAKAAALMHSLVLNHPFVDGNKRIAFAAVDVFLRINAHRIRGRPTTIHRQVMKLLETGRFELQSLDAMLRKRVVADR